MAVNLALTDPSGNVILSPMETIIFATPGAEATLTRDDPSSSIFSGISAFFSSSSSSFSSGTPPPANGADQSNLQTPQGSAAAAAALPGDVHFPLPPLFSLPLHLLVPLPAHLQCQKGHVILTTQRLLVIAAGPPQQLPLSSQTPALYSLAVPLPYLKNPELQQPLFGANGFTAVVLPYPGGGIPQSPPTLLRVSFREGGAFELYDALGKAMQRLLQTDLGMRRIFPFFPFDFPTMVGIDLGFSHCLALTFLVM